MINYFPNLYDDEILYSTIARYHACSGNVDYKNTINELFNSIDIIANIEFPGRLKILAENLPVSLGITADYIIQNHTLLPLYVPFLPRLRRHQIEQKMKYINGKNIKTQIGFTAGGICRKKELMYCPLCVSEDIQKYGEAYFHRIHQAEGVLICPEHSCILKNYPIKRNEVSRLEFIKLELNKIRGSSCDLIENPKLYKLRDVAKGANYLVNASLNNYDQKKTNEKYKQLLKQREFLTTSGRIKQREVYEAFKTFYSEELLNILESNVDFDNEYNWLKVALRKGKRVIHPIRNILLILFLCQDVKTFFEGEQLKVRGNLYYPCLNPVCKNYRKLVVTKHTVRCNKKSGENVITLYCSCGFIYTRKEKDDIFKIRRIKCFGPLWEKRLKELVTEGMYSINSIARQLRCDPKTVIKYADKLGVNQYLVTSMKVTYVRDKKPEHIVNAEKYKEDILSAIRKNPATTKQEIKKELYKQYIWLYKNEKIWLDNNMPLSQKSKGNNNNMNVLWDERDEKILDLLRKEYGMLMQQKEHKRITKSLLGRRLNILSLLEKKLDKLPKTKRYLDKILETVEDYQLRRVDKICAEMRNEGKELLKWKVIRRSGLRPGYSIKVDYQITLNLFKYDKFFPCIVAAPKNG